MIDSERPLPVMRGIDARRMLDILDHVEIVALSEMFLRWSLFQEELSQEKRSQLASDALDLATIAGFCGPDWKAAAREDPPCAIAYLAATEVTARGWGA